MTFAPRALLCSAIDLAAAALLGLGPSTAALAQAPHVVAPPDAYPRIVESHGRICEEDVDGRGCVVDRCREAGKPRDPDAPATIVGAAVNAEHPELCKVGQSEEMPRRTREASEAADAPSFPEPRQAWSTGVGEPLRLVAPPSPRYGEGADRDALFLARTRAEAGAAQGWSLPLKFIAIGGAVALPFLVADAASTASSTGGNATGFIAPIVVDVAVAGICAAIAVVIDNGSRHAVEREAAAASIPGAQHVD